PGDGARGGDHDGRVLREPEGDPLVEGELRRRDEAAALGRERGSHRRPLVRSITRSAGSVTKVPVASASSVSPARSTPVVRTCRPSTTGVPASNRSGRPSGVGFRYRTSSDAVGPATPASRFATFSTWSKQAAMTPPCTPPGGPAEGRATV